nr:hypothetical protein [Tanacetum cinerariifolium]
MTIDQQMALDEVLVPHASQLRIRKSNFQLRSDITSKESTLQVVYDVLRLTLFYKAFLVTADVPEIYMQEFWATVTVHHLLIRFKMNNKKRIVILEYFREMLHICPRIHNQTFDELLFEEEILTFLRYLGHSGEIKKIIDVTINKLHQPWRSFAAVINKCLSGKSTWKILYIKLSTKMPRRAMKCTTPYSQRNSTAYKEYYAIAFGVAPPKTKARVRKTQSSFDTIMPPPMAACTRPLTSAKGKQPAKSSKAKDNDSDDFVHPKLSTHDEEAKYKESFDPIVRTPSQVKNSNDESNDDESHGMNVGGDEGSDAEDDDEELVDVPVSTIVVPLLVTAPTLPPPSIPIMSQVQQFAEAVSSILRIVDRYIDHQMNEAVKVAVQLQSDRLRDEAQAGNEDFINKLNENIQKIIKEQVKTSYAVAADQSELELKKILIEKIESNMSIYRSDEQKNLYKDLVDAYECDKIILDTYGDTIMLKRQSTSAPKEKASKTTGKYTEGSKSHQKTTSESVPAEEPMQTTQDLEEPSHQEFETGAADDQPIAEASQHPEWFQKQTKPLTPDRAWNKTLPATHKSIQP